MTSKLRYRESYNCHEYTVMRGMTININWDSMRPKGRVGPPWKCAVFGNHVGHFNTFEDAETAALLYAKNFAEQLKARTDEL